MTINVTLITHAAMELVALEAVIVVMTIPTAALGVSNCDAAAQCGKDAATYNATSPLNVCCSPYGFVSSRPKTSFKTG